MELANRMHNLGTETAFEVLAKAKQLEAQGKEIIHLEIGEPDFDTPGNIVRAGVDAMQSGYTHYGPSAGLPDVREAIARRLTSTLGIAADPASVVVTPGAKPIMFFTMLALVNPGDEVIYPDPGFPIYESMVGFLGGVKRPIKLREERDFVFDVNELADLVSDYDGVKVAVDRQSLSFLEGATVDYTDGLQGAGFKINNPNVTRSCGCGQSFS